MFPDPNVYRPRPQRMEAQPRIEWRSLQYGSAVTMTLDRGDWDQLIGIATRIAKTDAAQKEYVRVYAHSDNLVASIQGFC